MFFSWPVRGRQCKGADPQVYDEIFASGIILPCLPIDGHIMSVFFGFKDGNHLCRSARE